MEIDSVTHPDPSIFRAYDIRGIVDASLTETAVNQIGRAFAAAALARGQSAVVVGRDGRLSGPRLLAALIEGLRAGGLDVIDIGLAPTPVVYFGAFHFGTHTCIAVTGSHNPPDYNGLKLVIGGETLHGEAIQDLYRRLVAGDFSSGAGALRQETINAAYIERIAGDIRPARPMKLAIDCGNGVAGAIAPDLLRAIGGEVTELYCEVDGQFPNHHPNPSVPANLAELSATVTGQSLELGLAFDGDGDRLGVVDGQGNIIWADRQMMLYAADVLERQPGAMIIFDIKCSRKLADVIREHGGEPLMWQTGHSLIKAKMQATGAPLAGEMSGHIFFKERWYGFDDALYTAARLLEILSRQANSPSEVFAALPNTLNTPELNLEFAEEGAHVAFVEQLKARADFADAELTTIDGLRVDYPWGWGLVRPSNTTPSLVIRFEADTQAHLETIQSRFREAMLQIQPDLALPF